MEYHDFRIILDLGILAGIFMTVVTAFFLNKQNKQHANAVSADLSLKMIDTIRQEDFRKILWKIRTKTLTLKENDIYKILNHYEYLAEFEKDGLLKFDHVLHQHGKNIQMLYKDERVKRIFDKSRKEDPSYNYINLMQLFIKINDKIN